VLWVPLLFRFPFPLAPPLRVETQVRNVDIAPTLLDLAGVPIPDSFEGSSLLSLITGETPDGDRTNFAALGQPLYLDASVQISLNDGAWTYARNVEPDPDHPEEFLFDRSVDPGENVNLVEREGDAARRMRERLDAHLAKQPSTDVLRRDIRIDPEIEKRLRAMGYLQDQ
jgi:arylsulfatase A-like enzyme